MAPKLAGLPRIWRIGRAFFAAIGLLVCLTLATPITIWYAKLLSRPWMDARGEILIVLAGSAWDDGFLGENTYLRCLYAIRAYKQEPYRRVVVSGGNTAFAMRELLVNNGIPADRISVESRSASTRESALFTREMLAHERGTKVILTSDYHVFRAHRTFRRVGMEVVTAPLPDAIKRSQRIVGRTPALITELIETAKIAYYFVRGWI